MKKITLFLNPIYPRVDHNANLLLRIMPHIDSEKEIITINSSRDNEKHPRQIFGIPVFFAKNRRFFDLKIFHVSKVMLLALFRRFKSKSDVVISTYQLRFAPLTASLMGKRTIKALYLMDPTEAMFEEGSDVKNEKMWFVSMLSRYDVIFTTKFIKEAMTERGYSKYAKRVVQVSFPMIACDTEISQSNILQSNEKITLFFGGSIYYSFRSPSYFFKIISKLDARFRVIFVGDGCEGIFDTYKVESEAELIGMQYVERDEMMQMMYQSDVLINIGNAVPVHLPSKTLEYINTGKPIVNFYKIDNCPSLYYTNRYELCLNLDERDMNIDEVAARFIDFCVSAKGKVLPREWILEQYAECTPEIIARTIERELFGD